MNNSVAGWANGDKVPYRVNFVSAPDRRNGNDVMYVDKTISNFPILFPKVDSANFAPVAIVSDASCAREWIAFICIHDHPASSPFRERTSR